MKKVTQTHKGRIVKAWVADQEVAARIPHSDLDKIQRRFKGGLEIVKTQTDGIAIYSTSPNSTSAVFEQFMEVYTPFEMQRLNLSHI